MGRRIGGRKIDRPGKKGGETKTAGAFGGVAGGGAPVFVFIPPLPCAAAAALLFRSKGKGDRQADEDREKGEEKKERDETHGRNSNPVPTGKSILRPGVRPDRRGCRNYFSLKVTEYLKAAGSSQSIVCSPTWAKGYMR